MKNIKLKWYRDKSLKSYNFGDDLAPYLFGKLSGLNVKYVHYANSRINICKQLFSDLRTSDFSLFLFKNFIQSFITTKYIISVGSIIQTYSSSRAIVWGSGIINRNVEINKSDFLAVRGEYTRKRIEELGFKPPKVMGDPALLLPLIFNPVVQKKYKLGVIPHVFHFEEFKKVFTSQDVLVIDLNTNDIEKVLIDIKSCELTISTSLHGIIVSHAYNIKSLWYKYNEIPLRGDDVKYLDYFSSVNIPEYKAYSIDLVNGINYREIIETVLDNENINHINSNLKIIQRQLLEVAPFSVKPNFLQ